MKEEKEIKIKLSTAVIIILVIIIIALGIGIAFLYKQNMEKANLQSEVTSATSTEINTAPVTPKIEEKKAEKPLTEDEGLKNFLAYMGDINTYKDNNYEKENGTASYEEFFINEKIMIASMFTTLERKNDYATYNLKNIKEAIKEIFNEDIDVEKEVKSKKCEIFYDSKIGAYIDGGGDASYLVYLVKIESQTNSNGIYEFTFLYGYPSEGDFLKETYGECDCFRTTVKIKVNENYKYSKYQLVSSELKGKKVGKIKDFIKINNEEKTTKDEKENKNTEKKSTTDNNKSSSSNTATDIYKELTSELTSSEKMIITKVENNNGEYTLKGEIYEEYTINKSEYTEIMKKGKITIFGKEYNVNKSDGSVYQGNNPEMTEYEIRLNDKTGIYWLSGTAQNGEVWRQTGKYRKVIVNEDVKVKIDSLADDYEKGNPISYSTVKKYFKDYKIDNDQITKQYTGFNFKFKNGKCTQVSYYNNCL